MALAGLGRAQEHHGQVQPGWRPRIRSAGRWCDPAVLGDVRVGLPPPVLEEPGVQAQPSERDAEPLGAARAAAQVDPAKSSPSGDPHEGRGCHRLQCEGVDRIVVTFVVDSC